MRASTLQQIPSGISKRFASSEDVSSVVNELNSLRGQQSLVSSKFEDMQRSVHRQTAGKRSPWASAATLQHLILTFALCPCNRRENSALWREVVQLRQRHEQQRRMIGKIMEFLSRLVRSDNSLGSAPSANR